MTSRKNLASEGSMKSKILPFPHTLNIALGYEKDAHLPFIPFHPKPLPLPSCLFPTYNNISFPHNLLLSHTLPLSEEACLNVDDIADIPAWPVLTEQTDLIQMYSHSSNMFSMILHIKAWLSRCVLPHSFLSNNVKAAKCIAIIDTYFMLNRSVTLAMILDKSVSDYN